jgi:HK97 family phage portal protein
VHVQLQIFGRTVELKTKGLQLAPLSQGGNGWFPWGIIRESFTGAWQQNIELQAGDALRYFAVYACYRLITTDCGKLGLRLVEQDRYGVWTETESPAFSPVLRKPNHYQTINKYIEQYIGSKLLHGNAYVLKARDQRGVVTALYVLDPTRVTPLVTPDGDVYYELRRDDLSGLSKERVVVPAREIIHDTYVAPYHPLIGLSPIYACGQAAREGLAILSHSTSFFENKSSPEGILTAPPGITPAQADELLAKWKSRTPGDIAVLAGELKYQPLTMSAVDSELIRQLEMTAQQICGAFGVPPYLVDIGAPPPYANFEPLQLKYHSQVIQSLTTNFEKAHDEGLGLLDKIDGRQLGTEFDVDDLIWMDTVTRVTSAKTAIEGGGMSPDEARFKYHGLGPTPGGKSVLAQQQNYSLAALAKRDAADPFAKPAPAPVAVPVAADAIPADQAASFLVEFTKALDLEYAA